jgi:nucleotide-binding universal stress UspA family protein
MADARDVPIQEEPLALKDILVHLDHSASSAARLEVAVGLAKQHQARLTGLLVDRQPYPVAAAAEAVQARFEVMAAGAGIEAQWHYMDASGTVVGTTEIIRSFAHCSDLVVLGQPSRETADAGIPFDLPAGLVLISGLPVLVVPYAGSFAAVGERVLVAWKAGRESTRALNDALPILQVARQVEILTVQDPDTSSAGDTRLSAELCSHLARHGVTAKATRLLAGSVPLGDVFLNRACDEGFDLLVMGAYAHGKEGRPELGLVARQLLRQMTVPVLMSH